MNDNVSREQHADDLYGEADYWHVNTGGETIHAKRMPGQFRRLKWLTASVWLIFFLGPYLRWDDRQAVLFDIPARKFYIFDITIMPQDVWMLSLTLLFFAILLAVVTSVAGRVFCGYFCFQTVWTDVFTWLEEKFEGPPHKRRKLNESPLSLQKLKIKVPKHILWILIGFLTGFSFVAWFNDAPSLWREFFVGHAPALAYAIVAAFTVGTYVLAGFMREQVCFWLCPYARIQGVMYDKETILPAYDYRRGEPRGKLKKGETQPGFGDCIDCSQCVAVCPTGIDIRHGQQEGCITCALCIDACDSVMDKIGKPHGLIRYASFDELEGAPTKKLWQRPRVIVYATILLAALSGILYGLTHLSGIDLKVLHERAPLYVMQSDGSIQNKYYFKILNKTDETLHVKLKTEGPSGLEVTGVKPPLELNPGAVTDYTVYVRIPQQSLKAERSPLSFELTSVEHPKLTTKYESMFFGPRQ